MNENMRGKINERERENTFDTCLCYEVDSNNIKIFPQIHFNSFKIFWKEDLLTLLFLLLFLITSSAFLLLSL